MNQETLKSDSNVHFNNLAQRRRADLKLKEMQSELLCQCCLEQLKIQ